MLIESIGGLIIALFLVIAQLEVVIPYRCFETTYRSHLQGPRIIQNSAVRFAGEAWSHALLVDRVVGEIQFSMIVGTKKCAKKRNYIYLWTT